MLLVIHKRRHPRGLLRQAWLCSLVVALCACAVPVLAAGNYKQGTIVANELNMRSGPGLHNPPIATLPQGARVLVLSYEGEWVQILYEDQTGFILNREQFLRIDAPPTDNPSMPPTPTDDSTDAVVRQLEASRDKVASFSKEETEIINDLEETDRALDQARKTVASLSGELVAIDKQIRSNEEKYREIEVRTQTTEEYVSERLAALYKLSWIGKFHVLAAADSMFDFFARKRAMEQILVHDQIVMNQLAADKAAMRRLLDQLVTRKNEKQATTSDLRERIAAMNSEQARREELLTEIRGKKSLQLAAIASLEASARELDRTVSDMGHGSASSVALPTEVPVKPFTDLKGLLMMPVKGRIVSFFGQYTDRRFNVTNFQSGISIKADRGEPIRAVYAGQTLFSSWFRGFGNLIIIDHGDHYYTVYAHLEELFKSKGDPVETGEVIATVGDSGSLHGAGLHFEIRHHGKPINPMEWIKQG
jgi:murein hydrolase activator